MLSQIETINFKSSYLVTLKEKLLNQGKTASTITSELQKILDQFDYSKNLLVGFILDSIFLWDVSCLVKLNKWQQNYAGVLPQWFDVIAEMDALISLANCNYNHPDWTVPKVSTNHFCCKAEDLGHPLINENKCVRNHFQISGEEQIVIITGANMAGKSTFLRTVGVNLILASNGCNVCAESFEFSPVRIYTNMRTSDNLMNDESYFYAELLRLQSMLTMLRNGENMFVIVDEMLKGTNSIDKLNGSKELIRQLRALKTHGIVATHDLGLTDLAKIYPTSIKNQCFEVQLKADELKFDYKLTDGVTRTMNATFLMKKMGIIPKAEGLID
jgi:DNA mismatch repair ATPase MutS